MKMSPHQKFINELRAPVIRYNRMMQQQKRQKAASLKSSATESEEDRLMRELKAKYEDLFGPLDDD